MMLKEKGYGAYGTTSTYVDINGNFIIDEWFDGCTDMDKNGIGAVILENNKRNFINREGKFLCREPFDARASFSEGYAGVYYKSTNMTMDRFGKLYCYGDGTQSLIRDMERN